MKKLVYRVGPNCRHGRCSQSGECRCELDHNLTLCGTKEIEQHTPHRHTGCDCTLYASTCFEVADAAVGAVMGILGDEKPHKRERSQMILAKLIQDTVDTAEGIDRPKAAEGLRPLEIGEREVFRYEGELDCVFRGVIEHRYKEIQLNLDARVGPVAWQSVSIPESDLRKILKGEFDG